MSAWGTLLAAADEPLGERIGGIVFWAILIVLLGVFTWAMVRKSRSRRQEDGARSPKKWTDPADYREHHRVNWSGDLATFTPQPVHWPLAVAAVFGICAADPWDRLAFQDLAGPREGLQEAWGIRSRPQLLSRLLWILSEGHRVDFADEVDEWRDGARAAGADAPYEASGAGTEAGWRRAQVRANARGICEVNFEAWDLVRAAMLTRAGYSLGWLSEVEAVDTLNLIANELQAAYPSWERLGSDFHTARWFWGGGAGLQAQQESAHDVSRQAALLDPERGPWAYVPWAMPVPASQLLLVDALLAEELIVGEPEYPSTQLGLTLAGAVAERLQPGR